MTDNIKPEHYRKGEIDLFEEWYLTYPFEQYRAIMQSHAEKYLRRNKVSRVEDLEKCVETIRRLKEKEIQYAKKNTKTPQEAFNDMAKAFDGVKTKTAGQYLENVYPYHDDLLKQLQSDGYDYLARDESGELWTHSYPPTKQGNKWCSISYVKRIYNDNFPEVKWTDDEPTKISDLLATYENGGENGK